MVVKQSTTEAYEPVYAVRNQVLIIGLITLLILVLAALIVSKSETISQIMTILLIGLLIDIVNTWIQNVGILRLYMERKEKKANISKVQ